MSDKDTLNAIVNRLISASDPEEVQSAYKAWSDTHDADLESFGYVAPPVAGCVSLLCRS